MRVLLIQPPVTHMGFYGPPLWALYLMGSLARAGIECDLVDGNIVGQEGIRRSIKKGYDCYGITVLTPGRWESFDIAEAIRDAKPGSSRVIGGAHASLMPGQCARYGDVVRGDGERALVDYIWCGRPSQGHETIDTIPLPAWDRIRFSDYPARGRYRLDFKRHNGVRLWSAPKVPVIFSRGCKGSCTFCSSWWVNKGYRVRDPRLMVDELGWLVNLGVRHFGFADDDFAGDREKTLGLCREIVSRLPRIAWNCTTRADNLDEEVIVAMRDSGCYMVNLGIETGDEELLRKMHKKTDLSKTSQAIKLCRKLGLFVSALMIVGGIDETDGTIERTVRFLKDCKPNHVGHARGLMILPGTAVYQEAKRRGIITEDFWDTREPFMYWPCPKVDEYRDRLCSYSLRTNLWHKAGKILGKI